MATPSARRPRRSPAVTPVLAFVRRGEERRASVHLHAHGGGAGGGHVGLRPYRRRPLHRGKAAASGRVQLKASPGHALTLCSVCRFLCRVAVREDPGLPVLPAHHGRLVSPDQPAVDEGVGGRSAGAAQGQRGERRCANANAVAAHTPPQMASIEETS